MSSSKYRELKAYLCALPETLPFPGPDSRVNRLVNFTLDEDWIQDIGEEGAVNRELEDSDVLAVS